MGSPAVLGVETETHDLSTHLKFLVWAWLQEPRNRVFIAICATVVIIVLISCFCFHFVRSLTKYEYTGSHYWHTRRDRIRDRITDAFFQELSHHALLTSVTQPCQSHFRRAHDGTLEGCPRNPRHDTEAGNLLTVAPPPSYQEVMRCPVEQLSVIPTNPPVTNPQRPTVIEPRSFDIDIEPPPSYESVSHITSRELVSSVHSHSSRIC